MIGKDPRPSEEHVRRTREVHDIVLPALREVARRHGYALAVHGSLERDIDIIAAPWREGATDAVGLVSDLYRVCEAVFGYATWSGGWTERETFSPPEGSLPNPTKKPHGRLAWTIHVGSTYFDLSVMPRVA